MKITLFAKDFQVTFTIKSLDHYGKQFFCFESVIDKDLVEFLTKKDLIYKQHTGRFTICREVKFQIS